MDFTLSIFRFNPKTDYLPYYKKFILHVNEDLTLRDMLELVKKEDMFFGYPTDDNAAIFVNGYALSIDIVLKDLSESFGYELTLEPLSKRRSIHDLIVDKSDFYEVFEKFEDIVQDEDKKIYERYIRHFYASHALKYDKYTQGTSAVLFASDMMKKYPHLQEEILKLMCEEHSGLWHYTSLKNKLYPFDNDEEKKVLHVKSELFKTFSKNPHINKISLKLASL